MKRLLVIIFSGIIFCSTNFAQYRIEIGANYGGNSYLGDGNPSYPFLQVQDQYGGLVRVLISPRYAFKFNVLYGTINGSTKYTANVLPLNAQYAFTKNFWDIAMNLEYNFFPLSNLKGETVYNFTPYIYSGFGMTVITGGNSLPHLPFGGGVKWKPVEWLTLGSEIGLRKMFTDELDTYSPTDVLNDPYNLNGSMWINNDYYLCFGVFAAVSLFKRKWKCGSMGYF